MYNLLSKVLALLILVTSIANPITAFSMAESMTDLPLEDVEQTTVSEAVYTFEVTPTDLTVTSKSGGTVGLQWTAATDNVCVNGYNIYRDGAKVGSTSQLTYNETVSVHGLYSYTVRAYDVSGNESADSPEALFDYQKPLKPKELSAGASTVNTVELSWTASQDYEGIGIRGYYIYRYGTLIKTVIENSYTDAGLIP